IRRSTAPSCCCASISIIVLSSPPDLSWPVSSWPVSSWPVQPLPQPDIQPVGKDQCQEADRQRDPGQAQGSAFAIGHLDQRMDGERQGLGLARDIGDEGDGGAKLAQRAGEAENGTSDDTGEAQRQSEAEEDPEPRGAKAARRCFQLAVRRLEGNPDGAD